MRGRGYHLEWSANWPTSVSSQRNSNFMTTSTNSWMVQQWGPPSHQSSPTSSRRIWALNSITQRPKMWVRYVDDTFVIWPHGDTAFKSYHNYQNQSVRFTIKEETEDKILFLDVLVRRDGNNSTRQHIANPTQIGTSISVRTTILGSSKVSCNVWGTGLTAFVTQTRKHRKWTMWRKYLLLMGTPKF